MKHIIPVIISSFLFLLVYNGCSSEPVTKNVIPEKYNPGVLQKVNEFQTEFNYGKFKFEFPKGTKIDSVEVDTIKKFVKVKFNENLSYTPFRENNVKALYSEIKGIFGDRFNNFTFTIETMKHTIEELIPNYYRPDSTKYDKSRTPLFRHTKPLPVVQNTSKPYKPALGLYGNNIALWASHGWYYNKKTERWEWQRPRLFQSVEDILPLSFVTTYLIPMLENAGANVFDPRERDIQKNSVVIDNDSPIDLKSKYYIELNKDKKNHWKNGNGAGFSIGDPPYPSGYNPFTKGTFRTIISESVESASVSWIPDFPAAGNFAVYISYPASDSNVSDACYTVFHQGIQTDFKVNQQIGGSTWIYLGEFEFDKGYNPKENKVVLSNKSSMPGKIISADAVRFGGGMGIIERNGSTSGRQKFFEAARYYLQYAGMPDTIIYNFSHDTSDYNDDFKCRAEYVNYLTGKPYGPNLPTGQAGSDRDLKGLGIPIDISLAIHTDAGIAHGDTSIGTLAIYSIADSKMKDTFPDGTSRLANRDLADIVQTQIVDDIRSKYDSTWNRRPIENAMYSEATRPNIPSALIELLSHQNYYDMKYALDPSFRFDVARAIYKGILRFLSVQNGHEYCVEPLPIKCFSTSLDNNGDVILKWKPASDPLESSAMPDKYIVYTGVNGKGFDNGSPTTEPYIMFRNIKPGIIYSYKVTAVNNGGESFPSEILSVCRINNSQKPVLIVNGFYRIAGPASVESRNFTGFVNTIDPGVPDKYDFSFTGTQYDFDSTHQFISNDDPGWGASHADFETKIIAGNSFDYPFIHGSSIKECGYSFASASEEAVEDSLVDLASYKIVDLILGEQKSTCLSGRQAFLQKAKTDSSSGPTYSLGDSRTGRLRFKTFPLKLQQSITKYLNSGGNLFLTGSYIASDLFNQKKTDSTDINFASKILKYNLDAGHASVTGEVYPTDPDFMNEDKIIKFNTELTDSIYAVQSPDAINSINGSKVIFRYNENQFPAGIAYKGKYAVVAFGFPFESINFKLSRDEIMKVVLDYLFK
jgi:hypothetical protein